MKHILIGGNGFLGRELVRQLVGRRGSEIVVVDLAESFAARPIAANSAVSFAAADISIEGALDGIQLGQNDVVHHLASKLIIPNNPRFNRDDYFRSSSVAGTKTVLGWMKRNGNRSLVFWSTDMVYGPALQLPRGEDHPRHPYGPYGRAKVEAEDLISAAEKRGEVSCTMLRPRLIIGPGRLGILETLFKLIDKGWPVPLIGNGSNRFQFVAASDCAQASIRAAELGCPSGTYNLGSSEPPTVYDLMTDFISESGSRSKIVRTPATLVKLVLQFLNLLKVSPMDPEQFEIADQDVTLDISAAKADLNWVPTQNDADMLLAAYKSYKGEQPVSTA